MDSEPTLPKTEDSQAVRQMSQFVTRIWEHPLLTKGTIAARQNAQKRLTDEMSKNGIEDKDYIASLYGSLRSGVVDEASDYDFDLIFLDTSLEGRMKMEYASGPLYATYPQVHLHQRVGITPKDFDENNLFNNPNALEAHELTNLLVTPDQSPYLLGNKEKARELRLKIVDQLAQYPERKAIYWDTEGKGMQAVLHSIKNWHTFYGERFLDDNSRNTRFEEALELRAAKTKNPAAWKETFLHSINNFTFPAFEIYHQALRQTKGAILLDPRFAAMGI